MEKKDLSILAQEDAFALIGKEWMLVTAGSIDSFNTMTASWGGIGWLWNKPVAFLFVRPERYTYDFIEKGGRITLSFLGEANRSILSYCGAHSGRDVNKIQETGLTPCTTEKGGVTFRQSRLTLDCGKLFRAPMEAAHFLDKSVLERWYNDQPGGSLHVMYVLEIEEIYQA